MRRRMRNVCLILIVPLIFCCLQLGVYFKVHFSPRKFPSPTSRLNLSYYELASSSSSSSSSSTTTTKAPTTAQNGIKLKQPKNNDGNEETYWEPLKYRKTLATNRTCLQHYNLVIVVSSAPGNWQRRNYIRKTWAFDRAFKVRWTTVFLVGQSRTQNESKSLLQEDEFHGDLVRGEFYDHYWNLTLKQQMGFEWATRYCSFSFLLKTDDDVFVNSAKLVSFLSKPTTPREKLYGGLLHKNALVKREGKWKVTKEEYSGDRYPDYCSGLGILLSNDAVFALTKTFPVLPFFRHEDVYVGLLADRIGIKPRHINGFELHVQKQCIPNPGTLVRHGFFGRDGTRGECFLEIFNRATEMFKDPGV